MKMLAVAVAGIIVGGSLSRLPSQFELLSGAVSVVLLSSALLWITRKSQWSPVVRKLALVALFFLVGIARVSLWGNDQLKDRLSPELESQSLVVEGQVIGLPRVDSGNQRFNLRVLSSYLVSTPELPVQLPSTIRLSIYRGNGRNIKPVPIVQGGEIWRLQVKIKRPHGFANWGGFDYERWLMSQGLGGVGYVRTSDLNQRLKAGAGWSHYRTLLRQRLIEYCGHGRNCGVLVALAIGDKSQLVAEDKHLLQQFGLMHLLAISGLHIGLVFGLGLLIGRVLGGGLAILSPLNVYGPYLGAYVGLLFAALYAAMAGFALPTQRALVMVGVGAIWFLTSSRVSPWLAWWCALSAVLWIQPLAYYDAGFWFSFTAVAVLILASTERRYRNGKLIYQLIKVQLLITVALSVVQSLWGVPVSMLSPMANLVAIPFIGTLVVPAVLTGVAFTTLDALAPLGGFCWQLAELLLDVFWWVLDGLAPLGSITSATLQVTQSRLKIGLGLVALAVVLLPIGWQMRILLLPALLQLYVPKERHVLFEMVVLDVGQGTAVLISSKGQHLLYDTGPSFSESFNTADAVVLPYLRYVAIDELDYLIISHSDNDHSGGVGALADGVPIGNILLGEQLPIAFDNAEYCSSDQSFLLGAAKIIVFGNAEAASENSNNRSCVLLIEFGGRRILLPGDAEAKREYQLLKRPALLQPVDVILASHHGSITSSSKLWVQRLRPKWVVFSSGYRNHYGHPHAKVLERHRAVAAKMLCTAALGGLRIQISETGHVKITSFRENRATFWRERKTIASSCET